MRQNWTLAQIRQQKPTLGLWLQTHSPHVARLVAAQELFDWLLVDLEHSPADLSTASMMLSSIADISQGKCTPIARVAQGTLYQIKQALDSGAHGIIVPMINTAEEAAEVVRFARYPPIGERGAGGMLPHIAFGTPNHIEYVQNANNEILVGVQIETQTAVENVESIVDTPGIDLVFIGPFDLHISLGLQPGLWSDSPIFQNAIKKVIGACQKRGIPYGTLAPNADGAKDRLGEGFTFVGMGTDIGQLLRSLNAQYQQLQSVLSDSSRL